MLVCRHKGDRLRRTRLAPIDIEYMCWIVQDRSEGKPGGVGRWRAIHTSCASAEHLDGRDVGSPCVGPFVIVSTHDCSCIQQIKRHNHRRGSLFFGEDVPGSS